MFCRLTIGCALLAGMGCGTGSETQRSDAVLATVGGEEITAGDLDRYERALPAYLRSTQEGIAAHRAHLQSLVDGQLMLLEAEQRGLDQLPDIEQVPSDLVNKRLAEELSLEWVDAQLTVTEEELREAYEEHYLGWYIWPAHILSASEEDAREIIRLHGEGVSFSELARERSLADDADKGGNLGAFFDQSGAVPSLREGAFHLEEGQVSEPIRTIDGYEVIKVLKKRRTPFESMRADMTAQMSRRKWAQRRKVVVDSLKQERDLRYYRDRIHAVLNRLHQRGLDEGDAAEPLIEYAGGAISIDDVVRGIRNLKKGPLPPDSLKAFLDIEMWILPDSLLAVEARDQGRHQRPDIVEWRESKRRSLIASRLRRDEVSGRVSVSAEEARAYYEKYLDTYKSLPGIIHMTEVLVETHAEAEEILARARAGERLEELAILHSVRLGIDPVGGHAFADSGRVTIESLYQSPYRISFGDSNAVDVGVLQGPMEVQEKYSVFRLDQPIAMAPLPYKQVQRPIRVDIRERKEGVLFDAFLDSLRQARSDQVQISEEALSRYAAR